MRSSTRLRREKTLAAFRLETRPPCRRTRKMSLIGPRGCTARSDYDKAPRGRPDKKHSRSRHCRFGLGKNAGSQATILGTWKRQTTIRETAGFSRLRGRSDDAQSRPQPSRLRRSFDRTPSCFAQRHDRHATARTRFFSGNIGVMDRARAGSFMPLGRCVRHRLLMLSTADS